MRLMRRWPVVTTVVGLLIVALAFAASASGSYGGQGEATPAVSLDLVEPLAVVAIPPPDPSNPGEMFLKRVTLVPGATTEMHPHDSIGILWVQSGTICFEVGEGSGNPVNVRLREVGYIPEGALPSSCDTPADPVTCVGIAGCELGPGSEVLLQPGDTVVQEGTTRHSYTNVGNETAVVLLVDYVVDDRSGGCGGRCH